MRRQIAVLLVAVFMVPQLVAGQTLRPGSRVRLNRLGEATRTGTVLSLSADTLEVRLPGRSESAQLALIDLTQFDVSRGRQRHIMRDAGVGFLVGGGLGAAVGAASTPDCSKVWICYGKGQMATIGGVFFGSIGGVLGLIVGVIPTEKWEPVQPRRISFVGPSGRHPGGVGLSLAF